MNEDIKNYFLYAIDIIKSCRDLLVGYFFLCVFKYSSSFFPSDIGKLFILLTILISFFLIPIAYGRYVEIIKNDTHISYFNIFNTHWINYYSVVIILVLFLFPFLFIFNLLFIGKLSFNIQFIVELLIEILSIFIFPLVFLLKKRLKAITLGFKCIVGNFRGSIFLVLIILLNSALIILYESYGTDIGHVNKFAYFIVGIAVGYIYMLTAVRLTVQ
jgi:hypothetical protein